MIPWQLGMQGNAAMYSNAHVWMQTFDSCCMCTKQLQQSTNNVLRMWVAHVGCACGLRV